MLKIERIFLEFTVDSRSTVDHAKHKRSWNQTVEHIVLVHGWISGRYDETLALYSAYGIKSRTLFQCSFVSQGYGWIDFHYANFELCVDQFYFIICTILGRHEAKLVAISIHDNF